VVNDRMSLLGELAGGLAHEFNNLHSVILGAADRLAHRRSLGNELRVPIELIRSTTERAAGITHQLLQFAKADNDAPLSTCDLGGTVRETLAIVRSELESYGIRTELDLPHLPLVMMPRAAIGQVVMNLVINARDALRGREAPLIRLTCRQVATSAMLLVEDNGPGVPEAIAPRIFDPFFTTKDGRDGRSPGTGIGLSLCRNLLERMGGTIVHERPVGSGCRFVITIPLRPAGLDWLATSGKEDELAVLPDDASILVAAPERQLRELLCDELLEAGLISHGASDSANAASIMSAIVVQAVLVDYDWPEARAIVDAATAREQQPLIIGFGCGPLDDGLRGRLSAVCSKPPDMSRIRLILSMGLMRRKV
jgi:two-component sensor histidine kinase